MDGQKDATMTADATNDTVTAAFGTPAGIVSETITTTATSGTKTKAGTFSSTSPLSATSLMALELHYFKAVSLYRRRNYEKCVEVCNAMLQAGHENNVQMFSTPPDEEDELHNGSNSNRISGNTVNNSGGGGGGGGGSGFGSSIGFGSGYANRVYSSNLQRAAISAASSTSSGGIGGYAPKGQQHILRSRYGSNSSNIYSNNNNSNKNKTAPTTVVIMPTWLMEDVWQLKMRALTQRVYIDDLETYEDADAENEEVEFERIATAARPGTSIKSAFVPRPSTSALRTRVNTGSSTAQSGRYGSKPATATTIRPSSSVSTRPTSGMVRPGTALSRPGSSVGSRPASRCGTASRVRATSAAAFNVGDVTAALYQASRINPTIYAERQVLVKALFQFLFYHEAEVQKAFSLCEAVMDAQKQKKNRNQSIVAVDWWWLQQTGRCLHTLHYPRKAESYLRQSLDLFPHPDTYLLLARVYQRLQQTDRALQLINSAVDRHPFDVTFRTEQGRIFDAMSKPDDAMQIYRLISRLNPINIESLACIALNYFYDNNPEMALMYYRRILSLGVHSAELYCNIGLCCLYGGQIDLVLPCFQRALATAKTSDQKADIWYNLSFVAITTGDFNLGRRCLQLCLTSDGSNGAALNNLAVLSAYTGDVMKAKSYLNAAKEVLQESAEIEANLLYMDLHYKL